MGRVLGDSERGGTGRECSVFHIVKDHSNVSVVASTICGRHSSTHCSKFMCELVHVFIGQSAIDLSDFEFLKAVLNVSFDAQGCGKVFLLLEKD